MCQDYVIEILRFVKTIQVFVALIVKKIDLGMLSLFINILQII